MSHIGIVSRRPKTNAAWLPLISQVTQVVNGWADSSSLVVYIDPKAASDINVAACYFPTSNEIEINANVAFGENTRPQDIGDFTLRATQRQWPLASGAIYHEACHAAFTMWLRSNDEILTNMNPNVRRAVDLLEESRIEARGVQVIPKNRKFLRASALGIILDEVTMRKLETEKTHRIAAMAHLAALTIARVDAGVLKEKDIEKVVPLIEKTLGADLLAKLRRIWKTAQLHQDDHDVKPLIPLGEEWVKLVDEHVDEAIKKRREQREERERRAANGEPAEPGDESEGEGQGGEGEGEDSDVDELLPEELDELMRDMLEAIGDVLASVAQEASDEAIQEKNQEQVQATQAIAKEQTENSKQASKVFKKLFSSEAIQDKNARHVAQVRNARPPKSEERVAAVQVTNAMDKARYRERQILEVSSQLPPGRLRSRAAMQRSAQQARGMMATAEPWRRKQRKHTDEPNLKVGIMVDISGSMSSAQEPIGVAAWMLSEAGQRLQAETAMIHFAACVTPTLYPRERPHEVREYLANMAQHRFNESFMALDGVLNLLSGNGARLLVVVSDGVYETDETAAAKKWIERCDTEGVAVLWMTFQNGRPDAVKSIVGKKRVTILDGKLDPVTAAMAIGRAAAEALEKTYM